MNKGIQVTKVGFSVNIENDYKKNEKINAYIPTEKNIKLLAKIGESILGKKNGSYILSGAYGSGKSFFISVLLNLLSVENQGEIDVFLNRAEKRFQLKKTYEKLKDKKYLVVFARDRFKSYEKAILHGILDSIKKEKLDINLNLESEIILKKIQDWDKEYPNIIEKLSQILSEKNIGLEEFKNELEKNKLSYIELFKQVYKEIFYGEEFINYESSFDIVKLIQNFEKEVLEKTNYSGVVYVFDEFGRYLETNINKVDVKEIQDMAEYCNSDNNSIMFLITHKDIFQYTNKLNKQDNIHEWEKVSGRFKKEHLFYDKVTSLSILSQVIYKNDKFKDYRDLNKDKFDNYKANLSESKFIFQDIDKTIDEFYPLNYLSAYILPELSQKVAQNERTMFAFLSSNDEKSLESILEDRFLIGLDKIYDYFEENFKFLNHESIEYKSFFNTKRALNLINNIDEIRFVKTLGVIEIYNRFSDIQPNKEMLKLALDLNESEMDLLLKNLQEKNIISYKRNKNYYKIVEDAEVNIENEIKEYIQNKLHSISYTTSLNKYLELDYYYPVKYNYEKDITRYFKQIYLDVAQVDYLDKIKEYSDGIIVYLTNVTKALNFDSIKNLLRNKDIILVVNKNDKKLKIGYLLKELEAIDCLILDEKCNTNLSLKEEYLLYKNELISIINVELKEYFSINEIEIISKEKLFINKKLIDVTYDYLIDEYKNYIEINYELMNKEKISTPMKKVRSTLLDMLIKNDQNLEEENFYENTGAINSVARTVLKKICYLSSGEIVLDSKWEILEKEILEKIKLGSCSIESLYKDYITKVKGYGLRSGIFTLFLGIVLIKNKKNIAIIDETTKRKQLLANDLIENLEKNPENYYLSYVEKNAAEEEYLENLKELLGVYYSENSEIEIGIIEGFKTYFYSLNRFLNNLPLKNCKVLSKIFNGLFQEKNAYEFLFEDLPKRVKTKDLKEVIKVISEDMKYLEDEKIKIELQIQKIILDVLKTGETVEEALGKWQEATKVFDNGIKTWLKRYIYKNDRVFLLDLTAKIKGFSFDNWSNLDDIEDFKQRLEKFLVVKELERENTSEVIEVISNGESLIIPLVETHSQMGKMLKIKLEATIKAMGLSVKEEEKKSILLEILKDM
ncbi:hypothetical protein [Candidatus Cetobacterium colombiensis]|uniref:Uncharacterized protein n=1 Tax=Candidatus Cetobacterium colombiensis TaxID=3073100 RepID=A0ABU4W943_9FUSO|nr:hypothetical protein [Candidatus Cetobacterium colombiensis]MDX8335214.1 hypothetical protein [Candidatus Cetobacterium colombiensis]